MEEMEIPPFAALRVGHPSGAPDGGGKYPTLSLCDKGGAPDGGGKNPTLSLCDKGGATCR